MVAILVAFALGVANFAAQRAVMASRHPLFAMLSPRALALARGLSLGFEFAVLVAALAAARAGLTGWLWLYLLYSAVNLFAAWAITTRRL